MRQIFPSSQPVCRTQHQPLLDETIHHRRWANGMQLWLCQRPGRNVCLHLSSGAGALDQGDWGELWLPAGVAHFLEHRLFEKADGDLVERFARCGAEIDAETSYTHTSYSCTTTPEHVDTCLRLLARLVQETYFVPDGVAREREIIRREIELYEDSVEWVGFQAAARSLFEGQALAIDIAGTRQSLGQIDAALLEAAHQRLYRPGNLQLILAGPMDVQGVVETVEALFGEWSPSPAPLLARPPAQPQPQRIQVGLSVPRRRLLLALPDRAPLPRPAQAMRREVHLEWIFDILFGGASSFFTEHYESGLIDGDTFGSEIYVDECFSFTLLGGDTPDPVRLAETLTSVLHAPGTADLLGADFERAQRRAYGDLVASFESGDRVLEFIEAAALRGCHPFELVDLYLHTTVEELVDTWHTCLRGCEPGWAIVGPPAEQE